MKTRVFIVVVVCIVLAACADIDRSQPADVWETNRGGLTVRVASYVESGFGLGGGMSYVYNARNAESRKDIEVMIVRHDDPLPISHDSVRFVNDRVCYLFYSTHFSVTTDAGKTWTTTDFTKGDRPGWIERVQVNPEGNGELYLRLSQSRDCQKRITSDFGRTWSLVGTDTCVDR